MWNHLRQALQVITFLCSDKLALHWQHVYTAYDCNHFRELSRKRPYLICEICLLLDYSNFNIFIDNAKRYLRNRRNGSNTEGCLGYITTGHQPRQHCLLFFFQHKKKHKKTTPRTRITTPITTGTYEWLGRLPLNFDLNFRPPWMQEKSIAKFFFKNSCWMHAGGLQQYLLTMRHSAVRNSSFRRFKQRHSSLERTQTFFFTNKGSSDAIFTVRGSERMLCALSIDSF